MHRHRLGSIVAAVLSFPAAAVAAPPHFTDEAVARGIEFVVIEGGFGGSGQYGCGVALVDLDNDGDDDIVATGSASGQITLFANDGSGHFVDRTAGSGLLVHAKVSGLVAGDYDGDGDLDLFVTRWLQGAILYRNEGALRFVNATSQALLTGISGAGAGASFGDYDGDGDLDLAIAMRTGTSLNTMRNRLYRNNGNATFTEVSASQGVDDGGASFQCLLQDLDRDGDCDLYVSNDKGTLSGFPNRLFRNDGGVFVQECGTGACIAIDSMGVCAGDLDMNGFVDLYCTNVASGHAWLSSVGGTQFERREFEAGIEGDATGWGALIFDADNDADEDLFACSMAGAPDYLWLDETGLPLAERGAKCGISDDLDSYCLASGDVDGDGDIDLLVQNRAANLRLYINDSSVRAHGLRLRVVGEGMNRFSVGALVDIEVAGRTTLREVVAGSCYKSQSTMVVHAGLGARGFADRVSVRWPRVDGVSVERVLTDVPTGFVVPVHPPSRIGDAGGDGRVDPADLVACEACVGQPFSAACAVFDVDGDCRVDPADASAVALRMLDVHRDGVIDSRDVTALLSSWGRPDLDITGDGTVDGADLSRLFAAW